MAPRLASTRKRAPSVDDIVTPIFNRLAAAKHVVYDSETSGLDWRHNFICGHVLTFSADPRDSHYLPVRHYDGGNLCDFVSPRTETSWDESRHPIEADLIKHLNRPELTITGHHLNFDLRFLARLGYNFRARNEDTQINAALIDEWQGRFSLEHCAEVAGVQAKKSSMIRDYLCQKFPEAKAKSKQAMGYFWRLAGNDPMAVEYASGDGTSTWQVRDWQMEQIASQNLTKVWEVESRLIKVLARMSYIGIRIDENELSFVMATIKKRISGYSVGMPPLKTDDRPEGFNVWSNSHVQDWMTQHGHTDWPTTEPTARFPNGQASFVQSWLEQTEAGQKIINIRRYQTLRDSFIIPLRLKHLWRGRVHTTFNQLRGDEFGTITGRLSANDPNLQAASKHDEEIGRLHRRVFCADPGKIWGTRDLSQIEPRLLAYYSQCKVLINGYNADPPVDAHTAAAISCNRRWYEMTKEERKHYRDKYAKRINQTIITGGGKGVLVSKYKVDPKEVNRVWSDYFRAMPEVRRIQQLMTATMRSRGYILTLLGRRCRFNGKDYVALNRALQGGNADIMKLKLVEIDEYLDSIGRPIDLLNTVHDSIDMQFDEDHRSVYDTCMEMMVSFGPNDVINLSNIPSPHDDEKTAANIRKRGNVPVTADGGEGPNWAIATFGEEKCTN